jgi:hypothetical protein
MFYPFSCRNSGSWLGCAAVVFVALAVSTFRAAPASAQEAAGSAWKEYPVDEDLKRNGSAVNEILRHGSFADAQEKKLVTDFFGSYLLPRWTSPKIRMSLEQHGIFLEKERKNIRNAMVTAGKAESQDAHAALLEIILDFMNKLADDSQCDPLARINAVLMIGELNETEPRPGVTAVPYAGAMPVLVQLAKNKQQLDAVRIEALVGILRQTPQKANWDDEIRKSTIAALAEIAKEPSLNPQQEAGHAWVRAKAAEALGAIGSPGEKGSVLAALYRLLTDAKSSLSSRVAAARALGQIDFGAGKLGQNQTIVLAGALGQLAADALKAESPTASHTRLKCRLETIVTALKTIKAHGEASATGTADKFLQFLDGAIKAAGDETDPESLGKKISELRGTLEGLLR